MPLSAADHRDPDSLAFKLRRVRFERFLYHLDQVLKRSSGPIRILDVGGTAGFWSNHLPLLRSRFPGAQLQVVNLVPPSSPPPSSLSNVEFTLSDARELREFEDASFDVVFSNSVIEHVGTLYDQIAMARAIQRVAPHHFVQTPARWFPIEPHFHFPFWILLPLWVRAQLLHRRNLGWMRRRESLLVARAEVEQVRLMSAWELREAFDGSHLERERFMGLTKSYYVCS